MPIIEIAYGFFPDRASSYQIDKTTYAKNVFLISHNSSFNELSSCRTECITSNRSKR